MGHKVHFCQGRGMGDKEKHDLNLGTVSPSSDPFATTETLVQNKPSRSCSTRAHGHTQHMQTKYKRRYESFARLNAKNHNLTMNSCRSINSSCRWTLATNYFQRRVKLNTPHLFRKNRISRLAERTELTVHFWSLIYLLHFCSLGSDFGPFWTFLKARGSGRALTSRGKPATYF